MSGEGSTSVGAGDARDAKELFIGAEVPSPDQGHAPSGTPCDERRAIRHFTLRMLAFWAPWLLLFLGLEALLWRVGETWPLERVIHAQELNPHAFFCREAIDQGTFRYKYLQILRRRPEIIALGSSRVMQFRSEMFGRQGPSFYNAGGVIHSIQDLNDLIDRLPRDATPKIAILGIDFWWLNPNVKAEANDAFAVGVAQDGTYSWEGHAHAASEFVRRPRAFGALLAYSLGKKYDPDAIGLQAHLHGQGFRPDGSKRFTVKIPKTPEAWDRRLAGFKTVKDILGGGGRFAFTDGISAPLLEQLRAALATLKARGVFVIGYSPPVITDWARVASTAPRQSEYWKQYNEAIPNLFRSLKIPSLDVQTPDQLGLDDRYMRDADHAYDTFSMCVLNRFCQDPEVRAALPDVPKVAEKVLASPQTNPLYLDFGDSEEPHRSK